MFSVWIGQSINLVLIVTSGDSTSGKYDPHVQRDFYIICERVNLKCEKSLYMSVAIGRGKLLVCISPSLGDRNFTPKVDILVHRPRPPPRPPHSHHPR